MKENTSMDYVKIAFVLFALSVILISMIIVSFHLGTTINDYDELDNSQCHNYIINDTFSQVHGSMGASTFYYIVSNDNIYKMSLGYNATKIYKWKSIIKGQIYTMKIYKNYAEFCNDEIL